LTQDNGQRIYGTCLYFDELAPQYILDRYQEKMGSIWT